MIEITINGKKCTCEKGEFLLDVARRNGFYIPTLCHHPAISRTGLLQGVSGGSRGKGQEQDRSVLRVSGGAAV